eukprot:m.154117 g.154117  ORF g.154117 m.154117 type:complete len:425 (-) comp24620_c0_seq1:192-1466(-)
MLSALNFFAAVVFALALLFPFLPSTGITHVEWKDGILDELERERQPVLLKNAPSNDWACHQWTPSYLRNHVPAVQVKLQKDDSTFFYHAENQPWSPDAVPRYEEKILESEDFFEQFLSDHKTGKHHMYASGPLVEVVPPFLQAQLGPQEIFSLDDDSVTANVWLSGDNVTAWTHYDTSHNFYIPLFGQKVFHLLPPSAAPSLRLHPSFHHLYRQTQVDMDYASNLKPLKVTVKSNEVLYLPPYWFHKVISKGPSISLNIWSASSEYWTMEKAFKTAIAFEEDWDDVTMHTALRVYLRNVVRSTLGTSSVTEFFSGIVQERYTGLRGAVEHYATTEQFGRWCTPQHVVIFASENDHQKTESKFVTELSETVSKYIPELVAAFGAIRDSTIRATYLANYVEQTIYRISGSPREVPAFINDCILKTK